jgi:DNA-binding response OmpR family regulator
MESLEFTRKAEFFKIPMPKRVKILVIDDDYEIIEFLKFILEPKAFDIITATSSNQVIYLTQLINPDIVILDLLMPDINGLSVCSEIRKLSNVPILVLSAVGKPEMIALALDTGADDYLVKPITKNLLLACVNKLTRRARAERESLNINHNFRMI